MEEVQSQPEHSQVRRRGRPPRGTKEPQTVIEKTVETKTQIVTKDDKEVRQVIESSKAYSDDELDEILVGLEHQGNIYDLIRNINELEFPEPIKRIQESGEFSFRWIDKTDGDSFFLQTNRNVFSWKVVNRSFPRKIPDKYFNEEGVITRGNKLMLVFMEGKLYRKWNDIKRQVSDEQWKGAMRKAGERTPVGEFYDPSYGGTRDPGSGAGPGGPDVIMEVKDRHPRETFTESGETI